MLCDAGGPRSNSDLVWLFVETQKSAESVAFRLRYGVAGLRRVMTRVDDTKHEIRTAA